jgi:hypothetical protein
VVRRWPGHRAAVSCLLFTPDGHSLVSAGADTTAVVWDVTGGKLTPSGERFTPDRLAALWSDLGGEDVPRAHDALWTLARVPDLALPWLAEHLKAVPAGREDARQTKEARATVERVWRKALMPGETATGGQK